MALRRPGVPFASHAAAVALFIAAAAALCWPMLGGKLLLGQYSDYYEAGYAYREFATQYWRLHHAIPMWNPHLLGGIPYVAGMHGDIFYPTAVLRWLTSTGTALDLAFFLHVALAGVFTYAFALVLETTWAGALVAGLAYELTGIVASLVHPGHDG